ncbi:MAG TPA: TolC family protein [Myxococcaceae bacterium]|nr:TolC family protein [Myxococcaceae bacterium]
MPAPALALAFALAAAPSAGNPLTLEEAVRTALERQPQFVQARAATEGARARADQSRSPLLPQLGLDASHGIGAGASLLPYGPPDFQLSGGYSFGLSASQLVWDFGQTWNRWQASLSLAEAQQAQERLVRLQVVLNVQTAWFAARAQKELLWVARETVENQVRHLRQVEAFVQVGTRATIDLAQVRTNLANARVALITAENGFRIARAQLNNAMGVEGSTEYALADDTLPPLSVEDAALEPLLEQAISARPELAALERQVRAQELSYLALYGAFFPSVVASTSVGYDGPEADRLGWTAQLGLRWSFYQGGVTLAQRREARANLTSLEAQRDLLRQQVRLKVEQASLALHGSKAALGAAEEAEVNARERLRLAEGRYQQGAGSIIELADAQLAQTQAAAQVVRARYDVATARARLLEALGG